MTSSQYALYYREPYSMVFQSPLTHVTTWPVYDNGVTNQLWVDEGLYEVGDVLIWTIP